jgi:hypothetical protein
MRVQSKLFIKSIKTWMITLRLEILINIMKWIVKKNRKFGWRNWTICTTILIKNSIFNQVRIQGSCGIMHIRVRHLFPFTWPCLQMPWTLFVMMNRGKHGYLWYKIVKLLDAMHKLKLDMDQMLPHCKQQQLSIKKLMNLL